MPASAAELMLRWLENRVSAPALTWLEESLVQVPRYDETRLVRAFALVPRRLGKSAFGLDAGERTLAQRAHGGWRPWTWTIDEAGRACLLLALRPVAVERYQQAVGSLFRLADGPEQIALLRALAVLPYGESFRARALEGVRSNSDRVIRAIAFDNPYPAAHFSESQWNAMVLKCLFLDFDLAPIVGLAGRMNDSLLRMADGLAQERRSAGRAPPPGLGRLVNLERTLA